MKNMTLITAASSLGIQDRDYTLDFNSLLSAPELTALLDQCRIHADIHTVLPRRTNPFLASKHFLQQLHQQVVKSLLKDQPFTVIGGDHSCAMATWRAALQHYPTGRFGLIWLDAHMDAHTYTSSPSGNLHGMPVAALLGAGQDELGFFYQSQRFIPAENLVLIGTRSYEKAERELLESLGVKVIYAQQLPDSIALQQALAEAADCLSHCQALGVSIDMDLLDPQDAPATATPVAGGLRLEDLSSALQQWQPQQYLCGLEIAEYYPQLDNNRKTEKGVIQLLQCFAEKISLQPAARRAC